MSMHNKIKEHMEKGYIVTTGSANNIAKGSSGGRRLREVIEANPEKYCYFAVKPKGKKMPYKAFLKNRVKCIQVIKSGEESYRIRAYQTNIRYVESKEFKTQREAMKSIKQCKVV